MRVLIIHNQLWTHYKAKLFSEINAQFPQGNHELLVAQIGLFEKSRSSFGDLDYSIHQYPYRLLFEKSLEEISFKERLLALAKLIYKFRPTIINFTGYYDLATWPLIICCKFLGIKTVLSNESTAQDQKRNFVKEGLKQLILTCFDSFFCFGTKSAEYLVSLGVKLDKITVTKAAVVNNELIESVFQNTGIEFKSKYKDLFKLRPNNFVFVGRFIKEKNLNLLLKAFSQINDQNWGLILIGDGESKAEIDKLIIVQNITGVTILPSQKWNEIPKFLSLGNIFVLPSFSETWGLVVNEAMVCGLPVIVSDQCGCALDLVENKSTGLVFESNNYEDLVAKMTMLKNSDLKTYAQNARNLIASYSPKNIAGEMISEFLILQTK